MIYINTLLANIYILFVSNKKTNDAIDSAAKIYSEAEAALDTLSHDIQEDAIMEMDAEADIASDTLSQDIKDEEEKDVIDAKEYHYNTPPPSKETESSGYIETKIVYRKTEEVIVNNMVDSSAMYEDEGEEHEDDIQETSETIIYCDGKTESIIDKPTASDTSVSSEDGTYPSTAEKSKEASPDTSGSDEPVNTFPYS